MRVLFVDHLLQRCSADAVVALTPVAYQQCRAAGMPVTTLEDYSLRPLVDESAYLAWQLGFFGSLPTFGGQNWTSRRIGAHLIKTAIDSVVASAQLLGQALDTLAPTEVYVQVRGRTRTGGVREDLQFRPLLGDAPLHVDVLSRICSDRRIPFELLQGPAQQEAPGAAGVVRRTRGWLRHAAQAAYTFRPLGRSAGAGQGADLFLSTGYGSRVLARGSRAADRHVLLCASTGDRTRLLRMGRLGWRAVFDERVSSPDMSPADIAPLILEIESWAGAPVGEVLRSRLETYLYPMCGRIEALAERVHPVLERERVDRIWAANPSRIMDFAVLQAGAEVGATRTLIQHGDHMFGYRFFLVTETPAFDEMIVSDPTVPDHLRGAAEQFGAPVPAFRGSSPRVALFEREHPRRQRDWGSLPICYVPSMFVGDAHVMEGGYFQDADYYRWQLRLLDVFRRHDDRRFIWKALPASNEADDPIPADIARLSASNVAYESAPFQAVMDGVGRVITDFPSTAAFEAARAGHPLLIIVHRRYATVRPEAVQLFGESVRTVASWEEAEVVIDAFLSASAESFIVDESAFVARVQG